MDECVKISPEVGKLPRQDGESYIVVDPEVELELRHLKALLVLNSMAGMDLAISQNSEAALRALTTAGDILSMAIQDWRWRDRRGKELPSPNGSPDAFDALSMPEVTWMLEEVSGALREGAVPKKS